MKKLVIGAPVFNEADGIGEFIRRVDEAIGACRARLDGVSVELLLVDDGSTDGSAAKALACPRRHLRELRLIRLSRNFGHSAAIATLVERSEADALILMDSDLQDDPALLPQLIDRWLGGVQAVRVVRGRRAEGLAFSAGSRLFYRIFSFVSGIPSSTGIFGLYDRRVLDALLRFQESVRYYPGLITLAGFRQESLTADRRSRYRGESRVGTFRLFRLALSAIFSFSTMPLFLVTTFGIAISLLSVLAGLVVVGVKLFTVLAIPGWASILAAQFFLTGLVIFSLGVVGQYVGVLVEEAKKRPAYTIESETRRGLEG